MTSERLRGRDLLLICALVLMTYHLAFVHQWAIDDTHFILGNPAVKDGVNLPLFRAVQTTGGTFYRPLSVGVFSVLHALFGGGPRAFHALAVGGHALASCLVAALGARLSTRWAGVAAGCPFPVPPVHGEVCASSTTPPEAYATPVTPGVLAAIAAVAVGMALMNRRPA